MKQFNAVKKLLIVALLCAVGSANAQVHPLAFGPHTLAGGGTTLSNSNWYKDYVGGRLIVTAPYPSAIAGDKENKRATIGTGTSQWPDIIDTPLYNKVVIMDTTADSFASSAFPVGYMNGKIALLWRGPIGAPISFSQKAKFAQDAGAVALVVINEYPDADPFSPGYTTGAWTIKIPVVMISNRDGIAISALYHTSPPGTVKMTITNWGQNNLDDLGMVPHGQAAWHNFALPYNQFAAGNARLPYKGFDGTFVANFGSNSATNVKTKAELYFTPPDVTTPTLQHTDSVTFAGPFTGNGTTDTLADSIMAMFPTTDKSYTMTASGPGRFDLVYTVSSDAVDQAPSDNKATVSFYLTDSLYSKGRYSFVKNAPIAGTGIGFASGAEITWGPLYYVAKGGTAVSKIQYSIFSNSTATPPVLSGSNDICIFKWVDGGDGSAPDSILQNGELELVSLTTHPFTSSDTSGAIIAHTGFKDATGSGANKTIFLDSNTWYYVAIDLTNSSSSDPQFIGVDGITSPLPRVWGRWLINQRDMDYSSIVETSPSSIGSTPTDNLGPIPFSQVSFVNVVDSFSWTNVIGMIPAVALTVNNSPDTSGTIDHTNVRNTTKSADNISLFPNPASDYMNVAVNLDHTVPTISYKIIDMHARIISKEVHYNLQNDAFSINTSSLAAGNYYLIITADGMNSQARKFTVVR